MMRLLYEHGVGGVLGVYKISSSPQSSSRQRAECKYRLLEIKKHLLLTRYLYSPRQEPSLYTSV